MHRILWCRKGLHTTGRGCRGPPLPYADAPSQFYKRFFSPLFGVVGLVGVGPCGPVYDRGLVVGCVFGVRRASKVVEKVYCTQNGANKGNVASREAGLWAVRAELVTEKCAETALQAGGRRFESSIAHFRKFCCTNGLRELICDLLRDMVW